MAYRGRGGGGGFRGGGGGYGARGGGGGGYGGGGGEGGGGEGGGRGGRGGGRGWYYKQMVRCSPPLVSLFLCVNLSMILQWLDPNGWLCV
eukprot:344250-Rhodomonas_salina.1